MAQGQRKYEKEYKVQAVKLAKEIGAGKAAKKLAVRAAEGGAGGTAGRRHREPRPCLGMSLSLFFFH